jgi:hypothetical protein
MQDRTEPDWRAHAIALAAAIQQFRNDERLRHATALRAGAGYAGLCRAWENYQEDGGPTLTTEEIEHGKQP